MINFKLPDDELELVKAIIDRACTLQPALDKLSATMDVIACHNHGQPLRLKDLSEADDFNLMHDVMGIGRHLNRENGQLMDCFRPRFSQ